MRSFLLHHTNTQRSPEALWQGNLQNPCKESNAVRPAPSGQLRCHNQAGWAAGGPARGRALSSSNLSHCLPSGRMKA